MKNEPESRKEEAIQDVHNWLSSVIESEKEFIKQRTYKAKLIVPDNIESFFTIQYTDENDTCLMCSKDSNVLISSCGCKFCDDCIFNIIDSITDNQIILNGYEKKQLSEQNLDVCPICQQKISLSYLLILLQSQGRNFENENEEAITRMINYCNTVF